MSINPIVDRCIDLVSEFFNDDQSKMTLWWETENPLLGNVSPIHMILTGRYDRLLQFIEDQLAQGAERKLDA